MSILQAIRNPRKALPAHEDDLALASTGTLAGWCGRPGRSGIQLDRTEYAGRLCLAILIPEPLDGVELLMTRRYLADMGATFSNTEPEHAA
jgi:hypothetical protein